MNTPDEIGMKDEENVPISRAPSAKPANELHALASLFDQFSELSRHVGFEYCSFGMRACIPISRPNGLALSSYPRYWQQKYHERNYIEIDPVIQRVMPANTSLIWDCNSYRSTPELMTDLQAHRIVCGMTQSFHIGTGISSLFTVATSDLSMNSELISKKKTQLTQLAETAYSQFSPAFLSTLAPDLDVNLTSREKEILRWTADGKTAFEIAKILNIATRTINFHLTNIVKKLNAANKTQAAVKAVAFGIIL